MTRTSHFQIRIALLDDHPIVRRGLESCLKEERDFKLIGSFGHSHQLIALLKGERVDVLLLDYMLEEGEIDGLALIRILRNRFPWLKILLMSSVESRAVIKMALMAGIRGFIGKSRDPAELVKAIRIIAMDKYYLSEGIIWELSLKKSDLETMHHAEMQTATPDTDNDKCEISLSIQLTARESEVIRCFLDGMSVGEIALKFKRSRKTISGQKQSALKKMSIRSDVELFKYRDSVLERI
ncbi:hypothetical protein ED28_10970 [[Pantoea] beijingensis]|uniref:DNA-binding response regulator n=1 Tax=[Pantoea] beijingensis TaxID=1324864 RepID=A0A443IDF4_9GAMM|nr:MULTISPECIES: response regulator transcription factor [Erwiniaceae]RWR02144.1 hypothetical protein ED28_10970 [[Pantoea] beijingensis]